MSAPMTASLSRREFAKRSGCDEKQVRRALERGMLTADAEGKLSPDQLTSAWRRPRRDSKEFEPVTTADNSSAKVRTPRRSAATTSTPKNSTAPARPQLLTLTRTVWLAMLQAIDWTTTPDWSWQAQRARLEAAASAVGFEVCESDLQDDGHHGGWQLRDLALLTSYGGPCTKAVVSGYGFELDDFDVLFDCRENLVGSPDDGPADKAEHVTFDPAALPLLAYPFTPWHHRAATA